MLRQDLRGTSSGISPVLSKTAGKATTLVAGGVHGTWTGGFSLKGMQNYDIRHDQALPDLQTAINKKGAYGYRTVRLR
jgi:hypothetical protein